ncbi:amidohydrolase family protein [Neobacillus thermocopriae]|uniref:amidohydrolase family protein n=1 Tax=Neobacillus thermocopriae TaxID=1215031 RepID=UPI002E2100D4|nr:amidohydrolase family protein [Neobacillus thermocopriae]MED3623479.1 amidohydrolase family protein [Neobacillus thermocopriae]MED3715225.1 amidohydrolase family protein [Neobacillus thermocopriae]
MKLLIKNTTLITMNEEKEIIQGSLLIENGKIKDIIPTSSGSEFDFTAGEVMDGREMIVLPGMTNAHYHSYSNLLKGTISNLPLEIWSLYTVAYGHSLDDQDIELAVLLGAIDMIKSGITSCVDHFPHIRRTEAALKAYEKTGLKIGFAPMMHDVFDHYFLPVSLPLNIKEKLEAVKPNSPKVMREYYTNLIKNWHQKKGKISILLGPNAPQRCTDEMLNLCEELSKQEDLFIHTHLLETEIQKRVGDRAFTDGIIGRLKKYKLLSSKLSTAHSVWLNDREIDLFAEHGVTVVCNPVSNLMLGSGIAPLPQYLRAGVHVALGTDSSNCGISHNLFEAMRMALLIHRVGNNGYEQWIQPWNVLQMSINGGAHVFGEAHQRGKIQKGYVADLVLMKKDTPTFATNSDLISQLVFYENGSSVDSVLINGEWVLKNKKIMTFDEQSVIRRVQERYEVIMEKCQSALELAKEAHPYFARMYHTIYDQIKEAIQ